MPVVVKARTRNVVDSPFGEAAYVYLVDGLNKIQPVDHMVTVPLRAFQERRERELIPACADCVSEDMLMHVPAIEKSEGGLAPWRYRPTHRHEAREDCGDDCVVVSSCTCGDCTCCQQALEIVLEECFVSQNPEKAYLLPAEKQKRYAQIGSIPEHTWDERAKKLVPKIDPTQEALKDLVEQKIRVAGVS